MNAFAGIAVGAEGEETTTVTREVTVRHFQPDMPEVYGTPFMIYLMEVAASNAIKPNLPAGWVSVGVDVNIRHLAPTPVGRLDTHDLNAEASHWSSICGTARLRN